MRKNKLIFALVACVLLIATVAIATVFISAANTAKLTVNATNGEIMVEFDGKKQSVGLTSAVLNVPVGTSVTLTAVTDGTFQFWTDNVMTTVSVAESFTFTMTTDVQYTAYFAPQNGSMVVYRNTNTTRQVLAVAEYDDASNFVGHLAENAIKYGYKFTGWSMTPEEVKAQIGTKKVILVEPTYEVNVNCTVSVVGGTIDGSETTVTKPFNTSVDFKAIIPDGKVFVAWKDSKGNVISTSDEFSIRVFADDTYTAVFSNVKETFDPYVKLTLSKANNGRVDSRLDFFIGEGNTLVGYGLIFAKEENMGEDALYLGGVNGATVKRAHYTAPGGVLVNYFTVVNRVSARGYVTYKDASDNNNEKTIYSNVAWSDLVDLLDLKHELRVDENGDFKVVVFSDVQCSNPELNTETLNNIKLIVDREDPDLVLFAGDNAWNIRTEADMRTYIKNMVSYIESKQIPWAHVYGNHDDEHTTRHPDILTKEEQQAIYTSFEYCISKDVLYGYDGEELFGIGNYVLPVLTNDGSKIAFNIWALDSGQYDHAYPATGTDPNDIYIIDSVDSNGEPKYNGFYGHYQSMEKNQVDWYVQTSEILEAYNGGETIPAMLYQHIPLQESYFAYKYGTNKTGTKGENVSAHPENVGLFSAILDRGDVKLIAHGHDHKNDFTADYKGVTFAYTASIGTEEYYDASMLGGRVINFSTKANGAVETHMSYINGRDSGANILDLKIDGDTVSNAISERPALVSNTGNNGKSVTSDATLNRKFIRFTGGTDDPSTYYMPMSGVDPSAFIDGFAVESLFRATTKPGSGYVGLIDYAENGGFALNYNSNGKLTFEMGDYTTTDKGYGYSTIAAPIENNVWYHVVCEYDASEKTITMYLNGVQVAQKDIILGYRSPSFSGSNGAYMCIGGLAQSYSYGKGGFMGDIATATVHAASKTETEVIKLYNAAKVSSFNSDGTILKLDIGADSVTNASATGPLSLYYRNTRYWTTIGRDAVLNRKVVTFTGSDGAPSTYRIFADEAVQADLKNGFAYEVLFKPTDPKTYTAKDDNGSTYQTYISVLDSDESSGGFSLRYEEKSNTHVALQFTFGTTVSMKNVSLGDIKVGEWCHIVFSYDGTNIKAWVNGTEVYSQAADGAFKPAVFGPGTQPIICIGAAAWSDTTGIYGLKGSIATCNIYSDAVDATKAAELYNAVKNSSSVLVLEIDGDTKTVYNASTMGPALESKNLNTIKHNDINSDFISFYGNAAAGSSDTYYMPFTQNSILADGFSVELMFRATAENLDRGILDFCEAGGFGISFNASGELCVDIGAVSTGYATIKPEYVEGVGKIEIGKWYHLVMDYNAQTNKLTVYLNGKKLTSVDVAGGYKNPDFQTKTSYISIGSRADRGVENQGGFIGDIAIANIYGTSISAAEAAELYEAASAKLN